MKIFYFIVLAAFLFAEVFSLRHSMHIFQLNSYKAGTHFPWLIKNRSWMFFSALLLIFGGLSLLGSPVFYVLTVAVLLITGISNLPKKAKKPLKYTARVVRMFVTSGVIAAAVAVLSCLLPEKFGIAVLALAAALTPMLTMLANLINSPAEWAVRRHYTNDAKKMLAGCPDMTVIGVTGSYGKTSVKFALGTLLKAKYNTLVTPENYNTPMGVVKTVRSSLRATHEMFVCEMGAKYKGDIKELCRLVHPKFGVITSIGEQHLETFGSLETIVSTKFEIYRELPQDGILFVNGDCKTIIDNLPSGGAKIIKYGTGDNSDYRGEVIKVSRKGTDFAVTFPTGERHQFNTKLIGGHNVLNITGAIAVAVNMGISVDALDGYVRKIAPAPHRLQLIEHPDLTIIDDAYNSNPNGCRAALGTLSLFDGCRILVTPGMVELGALEEECNRQFGREAAVCDYVVLVGERQTAPIKAGLLEAGYPSEKIFVVSGIGEAMSRVRAIETQNRKVVLLENDLPDNY